jgi:hypothetical protein
VFFPIPTGRSEVRSSPDGRQGESEECASYFSPHQSVPSPFARRGASAVHQSPGQQRQIPRSPDAVFEIALVNNGRTQQHQVYETMPVSQLVVEAARIFSLNPAMLILTLASAAPETLDRGSTLQGPPRVTPQATVFVFVAEVFPEENRLAMRGMQRWSTKEPRWRFQRCTRNS